VAAGSKDGTLYAVDCSNGQLLWRTQLALPTGGGGDIGIISSAAVAGERLIVATWTTIDGHPGSVCAVSTAVGSLSWEHFTPSRIYGPVAIANGVVLTSNGLP